MDLLDLPGPLTIWGLFSRGLGFVFLISFASLSTQVGPGAGPGSALPIGRRLEKISEDFPTWRRFLYFPTLLWLGAGSGMLRGLCVVGIVAAAGVIYGGPHSDLALFVCYACYLSLDLPMGLIFPWDSLLFEMTVLGLFLPETEALPSLAATAAPAPALAWAYRILLFRLMFGFGKQKFVGSRREDLAYLKGFLVSQPLPSPLGWYMQKLPAPLLKGALLFMFFVEIPAPFFVFFPGWPSVVCAVSTAALMVGIQAMGSFGYFSLLTIVLCLPLLDQETPRALQLGGLFDPGAPILTNAFVVMHTLGACVVVLFNSWAAQSWHQWAFWYQFPKVVQLPFSFFRWLHPIRWLHPYGVFPPNNWPSAKMSMLIEATWDRQTWQELSFEFSPSHPTSSPKFVAPHHPRGDQAVIYDTMGLNPTSLVASMLGGWDPYPYGSKAPAVTLCQFMVAGGRVPFVGRELLQHPTPPVATRITTIMLEPVSLKERREKGTWWKRSYVGPHVPPQEHDPHFMGELLAEPELFHYDAIFWRRRSRLGALMKRSTQPGADVMQLAVTDAKGIEPGDVERFWSEHVPLVAAPTRTSFAELPDVVADLRSRFSRREQRAFYRLHGRFAAFLVARLEPHYLHQGWRPEIPVPTYFHLWMLASLVIGKGREAYLAALADPLSLAKLAPELSSFNGLYGLAVFRLEELTFEAQKLRLITAYVFPHDPVAKRELAQKIRGTDMASLPPGERLFVRLARAVSGFFNLVPDIRDDFKGPRFEGGFPERYPEFEELPSGEVVVRRERDASRPGG